MTEREDSAERVLLKDPDLPWPGDFPYERLDRTLREAGYPGLGPSATGQRIKDALFDLMAKGSVSSEDRLAWDELRLVERRLLLDFFMYTFEPAEEDVWREELATLPLPLQMPDFRKLSDCEPDYERIISLPPAFETFPPEPAFIDVELLRAKPVDIGPVTLNVAKILGDPYVE